MNKIKYIDSFTFLRAIFIIAISIFHTRVHSLSGGFIAVNSFFVLSGFLIMLKLESLRGNELKDYIRYIKKRLKSLMPALYFVLIVSLLVSLIFSKTVFHDSIKSSIPSALSFQNIYQILVGGSYFKQNGYFSMFTHFWYISMQIQFIVIFTLVSYLIRKFSKNKRLCILSFLSLCSMLLMIYFSYDKGNISRVYYGTDTRIYAFLLGAIVYLLKDKFINLSLLLKDKKETLYYFIGPILFFTFIAYFLVDGNSIYTYRLIMPAYTILQAILIGTLFSFETSNIIVINKRKFGFFRSFLYYIGLRSYYIYIWQYVINTFITYFLASSRVNVIYFYILQVIIVIVLSELTYQIYEKLKNKKSYFFVSLIILALLNISAFFIDNPKDNDIKQLEENISKNKKEISKKNKDYNKNKSKVNSNDISNLSTDNKLNNEKIKNKSYDDFNFTDYEKSFLKSKSVTAVGDSVLINIDKYLREFNPNLYLDGEVGRDMIDCPKILTNIKNSTGLGDIVLIALGSNGQLEYQNLVDLKKISEQKKLFFVNTVHSQSWESSINKDIEKFCKENDNVYLVDWYKYAKQRPELFAKDFVHPNVEGSIAYRNLIERAILNAYSK
ncbi:acyltransferase [Anaerococcus sp. AGMB00486]|uniref:Acyltransferase n=1 Tax=Anaerococcus faecalis TaxID=2742993 RepID=A0ABX2N829_9FIRM|nr:acyltransferase family protein [Anaerococcus faecalis]NVF10856.1 acyltransferase [Anaerococcus faecalis]